MLRIRKAATVAAATALATMALGAAVASAGGLATDVDHWNPGNTVVAGNAITNTVFSAGGITVTCTHSTAGGKTPATGFKPFVITPKPTFDNGGGAPCTDSFGFKDYTTTSGTWKLGFLDAAGDEAQSEPNAGDRLDVIVPKAGAVVLVKNGSSTVCTITVGPTGSQKVIGAYNDANQFVVNVTNLKISITGGIICPSSTQASFKATYQFTPGFSDAS